MSKRFLLVRKEDVIEVSGTGIVADGVEFPDGVCVLRWRTAGGSTAVYDDINSVEKIHGHDGKTKIEWLKMNYLDLTEYNEHKAEDIKCICIWVDMNEEIGFSHNGVLQQVIKKIANTGFASKKEIKQTWLDLLQGELGGDKK